MNSGDSTLNEAIVLIDRELIHASIPQILQKTSINDIHISYYRYLNKKLIFNLLNNAFKSSFIKYYYCCRSVCCIERIAHLVHMWKVCSHTRPI